MRNDMTRAKPRPSSVDTQPRLAVPGLMLNLGHSLSLLVRWGRVRLHERLCRLVGVQVERATLDIVGTIRLHGDLSRAQLCEILGLNQSTISRQVGVAVSQGYVSVQPLDTDRTARVRLTEDGDRFQLLFSAAYYRMIEDLVGGWSDHDRTELARLLEKLTVELKSS